MILAAGPARAEHDPILGPPDSAGAKAKKVTVIALTASMLAAYGAAVVFAAQASAAEDDRRDFSRANGGTGSLGPTDGRACTTVDQCAKLASLREEQLDARERVHVAIGVGVGIGLVAVATILLWRFPNSEHAQASDKATTASATTPRIVPQAGPQGGGISLEARF